MADHKEKKSEVKVGLERLRRGLSDLMRSVAVDRDRVIIYDYRTEAGALIGPDDLALLRTIAPGKSKDRAA